MSTSQMILVAILAILVVRIVGNIHSKLKAKRKSTPGYDWRKDPDLRWILSGQIIGAGVRFILKNPLVLFTVLWWAYAVFTSFDGTGAKQANFNRAYSGDLGAMFSVGQSSASHRERHFTESLSQTWWLLLIGLVLQVIKQNRQNSGQSRSTSSPPRDDQDKAA